MKTKETQIYDAAGERIIPDVEAGLYYMGSPYEMVGINDEGRARIYPQRPQPDAKGGRPYRGQVSPLWKVPWAQHGVADDTFAWVVEDIGGTFAARTALLALLGSLGGELQDLFEGAESADGGRHVAGVYELHLPGDHGHAIPGVGRRHLLTGTHLWRVERDRIYRGTPPERRVSRTPETDELLLRCHAALEAKLAYTPEFEAGTASARMLAGWLREMRETFAGLEKHLGARASEEVIARLLCEGEKTERSSA